MPCYSFEQSVINEESNNPNWEQQFVSDYGHFSTGMSNETFLACLANSWQSAINLSQHAYVL